MGKSKKNKQNKSPPKKEQKSESIKQKPKEAVSHPQNPPPQTVSDEEQHSMKEQVTQSKNVNDIEPTTQSWEDVDDIEPTTQSAKDVDDIESTTQSAKDVDDIESTTQSANNIDDIEPTTQSPLPESSQDVQNYASSSSSLPKEQKRLAEDEIFFESNKMKGGARGTVNSNKVDREDKPDPHSRQRHSKRKDYKKLDYSTQNNERTDRDRRFEESNKMGRGPWRNDNSNDVDGNDKKDSYSRQQRESSKWGDSKKEDCLKQNTERIGRGDRHFEGRGRHVEGNNRTRDNWRENDHRSDDKGFDEFLKISKQKIPDDSYMKVNEIDGDLFDMSVEYSLAHCVAEDMNMGSGIAVRFSQQFKRLGELYNQRAKQGGLAVLDDKERYIYYLVTKKVSNGKPTLQTMWNSLQKLKQHIEDNNVKKLAIPRIGCGLDRLEWSVVKNMLEYTFRETNVQITVCNYQQCEDDGQTSGIPNKQNKCIVRNVSYPIADIEPNTAIIYFGAEDRSMFDDIEDLDPKFRIRMDYKNSRKQLGEIIQKYNPNKSYCLYGCIVRKTKDDPFDFINFQKCITQLKKMNKNDYYYVAFQAFVDSDDDLIVTKIGNMLRCSLMNVEVYVCWGGKMKLLMPQERSNNFY